MKQKKKLNKVLNVILAIMVLLCALFIGGILIIKTMDLQIVQVTGNSMSPTLLDGSIVIADPTREVERFDIVLYRERSDALLIKRVIGMPGDDVTVMDGHLFINGQNYNEFYVDLDNRISFNEESFKVIVPADSYFILGDNRDNSNDSRQIGTVNKDTLDGVVFFRKVINNEADNK